MYKLLFRDVNVLKSLGESLEIPRIPRNRRFDPFIKGVKYVFHAEGAGKSRCSK